MKYSFLVIIIFMVLPNTVYSQGEMEREVRVVKPYNPTLRDAEKINLMPEFNDTLSFQTSFDYGISPKKFSSSFRVRPIRPAKMIGLPLDRLYKSQLTLGFGNYVTPFAELTVNQLRNRRSALGLYIKHHSSSGKIKRNDDIKVDAPFSNNELHLYSRHLFRDAALETGIAGGYDASTYYGANPMIDTIIEKDDNRQKVYTVGANVKYYSTHPDSAHLDYSIGADYYYLEDHADFHEHGLNLDASVGKVVGDWYGRIDFGVNHYTRSEKIDSTNNTLIRIKPVFSKATDEWRFSVGLNSVLDTRNGMTELTLYPIAMFQFNIVKNVLIPYMGVTGDKQASTYRELLKVNPFIVPGFIAENEDHAIIGYAGIKGRYSSKMSFDLGFSYSRVLYLHSFVSDELFTNPRHLFTVQYDDVDVMKGKAEIIWNHNEKLNFILRGTYFNYSEEVYHRPDYEIKLGSSYNLRDKILVSADLFLIGNRKVFYKEDENTELTKELKPYFDGNLRLEYRYTKLLSFFVNMNNFTASRYNIWYEYPAQRFQFMAGFSYAL